MPPKLQVSFSSDGENKGERYNFIHFPSVNENRKRKYHRIHCPTYFFRQALILFLGIMAAEFLDPVTYILTDSEYYGIPVSYKAKCIILLVVATIIAFILIYYGCLNYLYFYEDGHIRVIVYSVAEELLIYLLLPCLGSVFFNPKDFISYLYSCGMFTLMSTLVLFCHTYSSVWTLQYDTFST